jgi:hypothetical protein
VGSDGGTIRVATDRERDGELVEGAVTVRPWEALVVELGA